MPTSAIEQARTQLTTILGAVAGITYAYSNPPEASGTFPYVYVVPIHDESVSVSSGFIKCLVTFKAEVHIARGNLPEADKLAIPLFALIETAIWNKVTLNDTVNTVLAVRQDYVTFTVGKDVDVGIRVEVDVKIQRSLT